MESGTAEHRFGPSLYYDLLYEGKRYPPKAVVGLAARRLRGRVLDPNEFSGGEASKCFSVLRGLGFEIVSKENPTSFSWIPLYAEIAQKVLDFQDRQQELLTLLGEMTAQGLKVISLIDKDANENEVPLAEIDPFTFFASFNRPITLAGRRAILAKLKDLWKLTAPVPDDFDGIPVINAQNSWAFSYLAHRKSTDVPTLWEASREALQKDWRTFDRELFDRALSVRQMALTRLTMGLFWLNPTGYLPFDKNTRAFFEKHGIHCQTKDAKGYSAWMEKAAAIAGDNFPKASLDAYEAATKEASDSGANSSLELTVELGEPFSAIFSSYDEAHWGFDLIKTVLRVRPANTVLDVRGLISAKEVGHVHKQSARCE